MRCAQGAFGRVFLVKFEYRDDLLAGLREVAAWEQIKAGTITLLGDMRSAGVVSGPKEPVIPPEPMWINFQDGREVIGVGTLFWQGAEPVIHLHGAIGRDTTAVVGCVRRDSSVSIVVEAVIAEMIGIDARRELSGITGVMMLELK